MEAEVSRTCCFFVWMMSHKKSNVLLKNSTSSTALRSIMAGGNWNSMKSPTFIDFIVDFPRFSYSNRGFPWIFRWELSSQVPNTGMDEIEPFVQRMASVPRSGLHNPFKNPERCHLGMDQYLLVPFLGGWTSIYQLFWCSPGVQGFDIWGWLEIFCKDTNGTPHGDFKGMTWMTWLTLGTEGHMPHC